MTAKSTQSRTVGKAGNGRPAKPYPDFPLFAHATRRWAKKIRGKTHYFGSWDDWRGALETYLEEKDDLHAGRSPQRDKAAVTVRDLCNRFMSSKQVDLDVERLSARTFIDYERVCRRLIDEFGRTRAVASLGPTDFENLYGKLARAYNINTLSREITMSRSVFKYAVESDLIEKAVKFGPKFRVPSKVAIRKAKAKARQENGQRMFEAEEIRQMLNKAGTQLTAMILLGANGGLGNTDCATLRLSALDLDGGWLDFPRGKTGIGRRIPLWQETIQALRDVIANRMSPPDSADADIVFLTKYGQRWVRYDLVEKKQFGKVTVKPKQDDAIAKQTAKLLIELGIKRPNVNFYALRHTFETIGGESRDQVAVSFIMGHAPASNDMSAVYRERISDERLVAVTEYVREWLYGYAHIVGYTDAAVALAKQIAEETGQAPDEAAWRSRKNPLWDALIGEKYLKESSGRDALNLAGDGDEAAMAWIRARDWGESKN